MTGFKSRTALALSVMAVLVGGCASSAHRMNAAADRDDARRTNFEHCRDQGRTDCDSILNTPVNNSHSGSSVREQERRAAYDRCVDRGGTDCGDLLHHD